jgi:hypothetical protein
MAVARVSSDETNPTTSVASGNMLAVFVQWNNATSTLTSLSTDKTTGNLTLSDNPVTDTANNFRSAFGYGFLTSTGVATFTPVWGTGTPGSVSYTWIEISGVDTGTPLDNADIEFSSNIGTGTDAVTTTAEAVTDGAFIWGVCGNMNEGAPVAATGTGFTSDITASGPVATEYLIQSGAGNRAATFTAGSAFAKLLVGMMAFKASGGGAAAATPPTFPSRFMRGRNLSSRRIS